MTIPKGCEVGSSGRSVTAGETALLLQDNTMTGKEFERYKLALLIAEPARRAVEMCENYLDYALYVDRHGEIIYSKKLDHRVVFTIQRLATVLRAIPFVWIARNGDDWTVLRAAKVTICLLLGMKPPHEESWRASEVAWFGLRHSPADPGNGGARSWCDIEVGDEGYWFAKLVNDFADTDY